MSQNEDDILLLKELLKVRLPQTYIDFLNDKSDDTVIASPILGFPISLDLGSVWGGTEFLRAARPDLKPFYVTIRIAGLKAFCLDIENGNTHDAPVVEIDLDSRSVPIKVQDSLLRYLEETKKSDQQDTSAQTDSISSEKDPEFHCGMDRLNWHMENLSFQYDHEKGGGLARSHLWRPYRFCVQDVILGITVIRHDRRYNRLEVDVFLTTQIPEYEADSGCRALALILLSDAYKSGGSMEIKFTKHVEDGSVPRELCSLATELGVDLGHVREGGITPKEAKELYLNLSGFSQEVRDKIIDMEENGRLSAASICYGMHHGVWTVHELEIILFSSRFPDTILKGSLPPEAWHLFHYDLFVGRNALMGGYLDRELGRREHIVREEEDAVVELEDDERDVEIGFDPEYCVKIYSVSDQEEATPVPWLHDDFQTMSLVHGSKLRVLLRARSSGDLIRRMTEDFDRAIELKKAYPHDHVCIMVPGDFQRMEMVEVSSRADNCGIGIIVCPEFLDHLDQEVCRRFEAVKVMRQ